MFFNCQDPKQDPALYVRIPKELLDRDPDPALVGDTHAAHILIKQQRKNWALPQVHCLREKIYQSPKSEPEIRARNLSPKSEPEIRARNQSPSNAWVPLPQLLSIFVEKVWRLRKPKLLVSMIGSSFDFDMNGEDRLQVPQKSPTAAKEP